MFKAIYFPSERTRDGKARRLCISLGADGADAAKADLARRIARSSSAELRAWLDDAYVEDLTQAAIAEGRSLSNYCIRVIASRMRTNRPVLSEQLTLALADMPAAHRRPALGLTFQDSKKLPYHRWYPYVEGFSAQYVGELLDRYGPVKNLYDPFGGSGTTQMEASARGITSYCCEINPFMRFVADSKVNASQRVIDRLEAFHGLVAVYIRELRSSAFRRRCVDLSLMSYKSAFPSRDFFEEQHLRALLAARDVAIEMTEHDAGARTLLLLAVASNTVRSSHMTRRADLRRRRPDEYKKRVVDVVSFVEEKLREMGSDLQGEYRPRAPMHHIADDCRSVRKDDVPEIDLAVTSPPYLNGTNYFRNTKLEMWLLKFLNTEVDLPAFTATAVAAGINNVNRGRPCPHRFDSVEHVVEQLEATDGDRRIPLLVRCYFSDMLEVCRSVWSVLRPGGRLILDMGDSRFYGVHVPTDRLLCEVAETVGFEVEDGRVLARRLSYDKSLLRQVEIVLRRPSATRSPLRPPSKPSDVELVGDDRHSKRAAGILLSGSGGHVEIEAFARTLPYRDMPFSKRNWGHPLHSLSSYQGKMKPAMAHWLVRSFTEPGMTVLDPVGGVGTIAFEACLAGRPGWTNDLSPFPHAVATGKVCAPSTKDVERALGRLTDGIRDLELKADDYAAADFGLNGSVRDFYHARTLEEVLRARNYFTRLSCPSDADLFVKASLMHILHGNRPYALSRTSHPITPFHPSGPRRYRPLIPALRTRIDAALSKPLPPTFVRGRSTHGDFRGLVSASANKVDRIITSPPFWGMRFDRPNWLRLWFCGWEAEDFHERSLGFLERQQKQSLSVYYEFYDVCHSLLNDNGLMIMHLGGSEKHSMLEELASISSRKFRLVGLVSEDISKLERHGIKDKGLTTTSNFLFLEPLRAS